MNRRLTPSKNSRDFYPTPAWATEALLSRESFEGEIWECACGDGAMSRVLEALPNKIISTDLHAHGYGKHAYDFTKATGAIDNVVTNPPFNIAEAFLRSSLRIVKNGKICFLLRLSFLEGSARYWLFWANFHPTRIWVFSERLTTYPHGAEEQGRGTITLAWFVWDRPATNANPELGWIPPRKKPKGDG